MVTLSGVWELFPEQTRHPHPPFSAETLKIIKTCLEQRWSEAKSETTGKIKTEKSKKAKKPKKTKKRQRVYSSCCSLLPDSDNMKEINASRNRGGESADSTGNVLHFIW